MSQSLKPETGHPEPPFFDHNLAETLLLHQTSCALQHHGLEAQPGSQLAPVPSGQLSGPNCASLQVVSNIFSFTISVTWGVVLNFALPQFPSIKWKDNGG